MFNVVALSEDERSLRELLPLLIAVCLAELWRDSWFLAGQRMTEVSPRKSEKGQRGKEGDGEEVRVESRVILAVSICHAKFALDFARLSPFAKFDGQTSFVYERSTKTRYEILLVERRGLIAVS